MFKNNLIYFLDPHKVLTGARGGRNISYEEVYNIDENYLRDVLIRDLKRFKRALPLTSLFYPREYDSINHWKLSCMEKPELYYKELDKLYEDCRKIIINEFYGNIYLSCLLALDLNCGGNIVKAVIYGARAAFNKV